MIVAHAMFKAALFMVVGIIDHSTGTCDASWRAPRAAARPDGYLGRRRSEHGRAAVHDGDVGQETAFAAVWVRVRSRPGRPTPSTDTDRLGDHLRLHHPVPVGRVRPQGTHRAERRRRQVMHPPGPLFYLAPDCPRGRRCRRRIPPPTDRLTARTTRRPCRHTVTNSETTWRCGTDPGFRWCSRSS